MSPALLIKRARQEAGLTQAELAERLGTTQPAVAKLERPGCNPRWETVRRAVEATGTRLETSLSEYESGVDGSLIAKNLKLTPAERVAAATRLGEVATRIRRVR